MHPYSILFSYTTQHKAIAQISSYSNMIFWLFEKKYMFLVTGLRGCRVCLSDSILNRAPSGLGVMVFNTTFNNRAPSRTSLVKFGYILPSSSKWDFIIILVKIDLTNMKRRNIKCTTHYYSAIKCIFKVLAHFSLKRSNFVNCKKLPFAVRWWVELLKRDYPLTSHSSLI